MVDREQVLTAYRLLLGRDPESEGVLDRMAGMPDLDAVAGILLSSEEFRRRASLGHLDAAAERWVCAEIRDGLRLWINLMDLGVGAGALRDDWEPDETRFILSQLEPGGFFVDVGANIGWFTILAAHRVGPAGHVASFEPRADLYRRLRDSVAANGFQGRTSIFNIALGEAETEMQIASVLEEYNPGHSFLVSGNLEAGAVSWGKVPVRPLDAIDFGGRRVDLIKVDVEGAEAMVLGGALELLRRDKPVLITEFFPEWLRKVSGIEPQAYLSMLRDIGYQLHELTAEGPGQRFEGLPLAADNPGFFTNIVAHCEPRHFRSVSASPLGTVAAADTVVDTSALAQAREIAALQVRIASMQSGLNALTQQIEAARDALSNVLYTTAQAHTEALEIQARALKDHTDWLATRAEAQERQFIRALNAIQHIDADVGHLATSAVTTNAARLSDESLRPILVQLQYLGGEISRLREQFGNRKKPLIARIWRELKKPFGRRFWERQRQKRMSRKLGNRQTAQAPAGLLSWRDVQTTRAKVPALAGVEKPIVMIIDDRLPEPDRDSGSLDAMNMIRTFIDAGWHVIYGVHPKRDQDPRYAKSIEAAGVRTMGDSDAASVQEFIERHGVHVDAFVLSRVSAGGQFLELIRYNCPQAKVLFNTVDLHHLREARAARLTGDRAALEQAEKTRDREEFLAAKSDLTLVVSSIEEEILQASVPGCTTAVLPLARPVRHPGVPFEDRFGIGFIGGFQHLPNVDAVTHFLSDVWPLVHARDPSVALEIVGADLPEAVLQGVTGPVTYRGALPEVESWFDSLRLTVAPLRVGAGAKGKVASSLCNGLPAVISPVAAEGMDLADGAEVFVAESPSAMAEAILRLHSDPELWAKASAAAEATAERSLSVANFEKVLKEALIRLELPILALPPEDGRIKLED